MQYLACENLNFGELSRLFLSLLLKGIKILFLLSIFLSFVTFIKLIYVFTIFIFSILHLLHYYIIILYNCKNFLRCVINSIIV